MVFRPDSHHFDEEQDPDPQLEWKAGSGSGSGSVTPDRYLSSVVMLEAEVVGEGDGKAAEDLTLPHLHRSLLSIMYKFIEVTFFTSTKYSKTPHFFVCYFWCDNPSGFVSLGEPLQCSQLEILLYIYMKWNECFGVTSLFLFQKNLHYHTSNVAIHYLF